MLSSKIQSFFPSFTKATNSSNEAKNQVISGNVTFAKSILDVKNSSAYRIDTRSPETIRKFGFSGTNNNDPLEVRVFGDKTVFASGTKGGVEKFMKSDGFINDKSFCHIYKINTTNHKVFSFAKNYKENPDELIAGISRLATKELGLLREEAMRLAAKSIHNDYLAVDELQIEGPIKPESIKHIETVKMK